MAVLVGGCGGDDAKPKAKATATPSPVDDAAGTPASDTNCAPVEPGRLARGRELDKRYSEGKPMQVRQGDQTFRVTANRVTASKTIPVLAGPTGGKYRTSGQFVTIRFRFENVGPKSMSASSAARYSLALDSGGDRFAIGQLASGCRWLSVSAAKRAKLTLPTAMTKAGDSVSTAVVYVVPAVESPLEWRASLDKRAVKLPVPK